MGQLTDEDKKKNRFNADKISNMVRVWPSGECIDQIDHLDESQLGPAERWFKPLVQPRTLHERLVLLDCQNQWPGDYKEQYPIILQQKELYGELLHSNAMYDVLSMTLAVGNYLNGGTPKGQADGFEIEVLFDGKIADVKGSDGKTSLLKYIIDKIVADDPGFPDEVRELQQ